MQDNRKNNGGHSTKGKAGRKPKADEEKALYRIKEALRRLYKKTEGEEDEAIILFLVDFGQTKDGMKMFGEHILGKPRENFDITSNDEEISIN